MTIINLIKDIFLRKKLIRFYEPWVMFPYDLNNGMNLFWNTSVIKPQNTNKKQYKQLIAVNGTGTLTGSSAIDDFLAEFSECTVLGGRHGSKNDQYDSKRGDVNEFDYWKTSAGSVLSLEGSIFSNEFSGNINAAFKFSIFVIKNLNSGVWIFDDFFLQRSKKFFFDLIDYYKINIVDHKKSKYIQYNYSNQIKINNIIWKDFTLKEYRAHAKKYFEDWLKHLPSKKFLVLDQLMGSRKFDGELFEDYFGDIKMIYVWRDPRDQYERCRNRNLNYIPIDPIIFSKRYRKIVSDKLNARHKNLLVIRFEEFVTEYDRISKQIIDFLGLDPAKHTKKFEYFDPEVSGKKIGIHKTYHDQEAIKIIEQECSEYCWNK